MGRFWGQLFGVSEEAEAAWVQRCAQSLIRMRPQDDLEQTIGTALDLWPVCRHMDPVLVAHVQAGLLGAADA